MITGAIPLPGDPGQAFGQAFNGMDDFFQKIKQHQLEQQKLQELMRHQQVAEQLSKAAAGRAQAASGRNQTLFDEKMKGVKFQNALRDMMMQGFQNNRNSMETPARNMPSYMPSLGMGEQEQPQLEEIPNINTSAINPLDAFRQSKSNWNEEIIPGSGITKSDLIRKELKIPTAGRGGALQGPAREAADLERLRLQAGKDSDVYKNALDAYKAKNEARTDLSDLRNRTKAGLRPGEKEFFDPESGAPIGKEIPLTGKERESEEGNILFNELYPYVYKGAARFSGEGSIRNLEAAAAQYKTNPQAKKAIDDFLLAEKMLAAATVNESSTLKAGKTNRTYQMLKASLDAQDVPKIIKRLTKEYKLPATAQLQASMRYQKLLSDARKKARTSTPATQKLYYNPEAQAKHQQEIAEGNVQKKKGEYNDNDRVKVQTPEGVKIMTYAEAKKLGAQ